MVSSSVVAVLFYVSSNIILNVCLWAEEDEKCSRITPRQCRINHTKNEAIMRTLLLLPLLHVRSKGERERETGCEELLHWAQILREMLHNA